MIADDSVAAYEAFVALFFDATFGPRTRSLLERRREMTAWANAVAINTGQAYEAFLASYPASGLAQTARKMVERVRNRTDTAPAFAPTLVALGPSCPGATPSLPTRPTLLQAKRVEKEPHTRRAEKSTPKPVGKIGQAQPAAR